MKKHKMISPNYLHKSAFKSAKICETKVIAYFLKKMETFAHLVTQKTDKHPKDACPFTPKNADFLIFLNESQCPLHLEYTHT